MKDPRPQPISRKDYRPPAYFIDTVRLRFELDPRATVVEAELAVRRNPAVEGNPALVLDGEDLQLQSIAIDGQPLAAERYAIVDRTLRIDDVPAAFVLTTKVQIDPTANTELSGLYLSGDALCTQCEAEGFRRITYFPDRPDVMARYTTTIVADREHYPVLLSNGNRTEEGTTDDGRRFVTWVDPHPKPSYLFALVAAQLHCHPGTFTTMSGKTVRLEIWVEPRNADACEHALVSLQKAMAWDEQVFGREYDLDIYMIVAVSHFNFAAMENKGLNIFNAKYVLARPETATDDDYEDIEAVIAHEYFHNWTGNRVTCRDWFQLTLKEGLTVFRDEQFTADMTSAAVKRVADVRVLRTSQFAEDRGPTAHPIRPESYIEMSNFYTVTVYNKGAEVIRMIHTLLGPEGFRRGMDTYFERHDGQAVTCDDFRAAMAAGGATDLDQFGRWYTQVGTPVVSVQSQWDEAAGALTLELAQRPGERGAPDSEPLHIPIAVGLLGPDGSDLPLRPDDDTVRVRSTTALVELREPQMKVTFSDLPARPVVSMLRGFSAPVRLDMVRDRDDLSFLSAHDSDPFNRWDAGQQLASQVILELVDRHAASEPLDVDPGLVTAVGHILADDAIDGSMKSLMLTLPDERMLAQARSPIDVDGIHQMRNLVRRTIADAHAPVFRAIYDRLRPQGDYRADREAIAARRLRHVCLGYLTAQSDDAVRGQAIMLADALYQEADNMSDRQAALARLVEAGGPARETALDDFYDRYRSDPLVIDKWFAVQAVSRRPDTLQRVRALTQHADFTLTNPNRARALLGSFSARNQVRFHGADGGGYVLLGDKILELDAINPQVAARLIGVFGQWRHFDEGRQALMKAQLTRIIATKSLSRDVYELASKALE
jgi:aminopeptidase N